MSSKCSCTCICGIVLPLNPSATTVYARSAFYPNLRFTLSLQSAFYTQSAFYPWSTVCILHWPLILHILLSLFHQLLNNNLHKVAKGGRALAWSVCDKRRLQTCRPANLQTRRFAEDLHFLWQGFGLILFILCLLLANRKLQSMSEANNSASGLQTQQCPIRQVTGNPCRGRLNIGRTVT